MCCSVSTSEEGRPEMGKLTFFFKRLVRMDFGKMWQTTKLLRERSGRSRLWLLCDMLRCALIYNAG